MRSFKFEYQLIQLPKLAGMAAIAEDCPVKRIECVIGLNGCLEWIPAGMQTAASFEIGSDALLESHL